MSHTIVTPPMVFARNMVEVKKEMEAKGFVKPIVASLAGDVEVERLHRSKGFKVLLRDGLDRDVVDVDLALADQKKQQVKRAFEDLKFDAVIGFGSHGAERFGRRWGAANKNARRRRIGY
jgi:hypothetical protein